MDFINELVGGAKAARQGVLIKDEKYKAADEELNALYESLKKELEEIGREDLPKNLEKLLGACHVKCSVCEDFYYMAGLADGVSIARRVK